MGAIAVYIFVLLVANVAGLYYYFDDKRKEKEKQDKAKAKRKYRKRESVPFFLPPFFLLIKTTRHPDVECRVFVGRSL